MAGNHALPRSTVSRAFWPRELRRAALLLGASAALLWSSFAIGRWIVSFPDSGPIYLDLLIAWGAVLLHVSAWPNLWIGLRDLRVRRPLDGNSIVAWRSFLLTLVMIGAAILVLPLEYHAFTSTGAWLFIVYVTAFPYLGWTFVPILALHGILFGRVANFLESRSRQIATAGALVLFAVAAATAAVDSRIRVPWPSLGLGASAADCSPPRPSSATCSSPSASRPNRLACFRARPRGRRGDASGGDLRRGPARDPLPGRGHLRVRRKTGPARP